jgi:prepilin-type N-terminal cleavage/methylation domain-containing protein
MRASASTARRSRQAGFTLIDLLFVIALIGLLSAIAIPGMMRTKGAAQATSAVATLKVFNSSQLSFAISCGFGFYATSLPTLGTKPPAALDAFLPLELANGLTVTKSGYLFSLAGTPIPGTPASCNGVPGGQASSGYAAIADTLDPAGGRFFGTNTDGVVFEHTATLSGSMPETGAPALGIMIRQ